MDTLLPKLPTITYWIDPVETATVFVPTLIALLAVSFYSIITG